MQFIGTGGIPAPRLIDAKATKADYKVVIRSMQLIYQKAELVHSDLSEYNIMNWMERSFSLILVQPSLPDIHLQRNF